MANILLLSSFSKYGSLRPNMQVGDVQIKEEQLSSKAQQYFRNTN